MCYGRERSTPAYLKLPGQPEHLRNSDALLIVTIFIRHVLFHFVVHISCVPPEQLDRKAAHELAAHYGLVTQSYDLEPKRYVSVIKQKVHTYLSTRKAGMPTLPSPDFVDLHKIDARDRLLSKIKLLLKGRRCLYPRLAPTVALSAYSDRASDSTPRSMPVFNARLLHNPRGC